ncbi:hypothetical protein J6590_006511, partial [Homalodisca vitripennis]
MDTVKTPGGRTSIGLCVGGQTIKQLYEQVKIHSSSLSENLMIFIGTNDILKNNSLEQMKTDMKDLVEYLINSNKKLIILTLPPIPKVAKDIGIRGKVKDFNRFIRALDNGDTIKINHVTPHFVDHNELGCNLKYFEQNINFGGKTFADLVHLNIDGLKLLKESIDEFFNQTNEELKGV